MIPIQLTLSGFLSYLDPVKLDFTNIDLACIAGANGAGKSSLLDAITWALFGQARKNDDSLINAQSPSKTAEVSLIFSYENNTYRVQRTKSRDKTGIVSFQIFQPAEVEAASKDQNSRSRPLETWPVPGSWKPLDGSSSRETNARIQETLGLNYETFVNAYMRRR